MAETLGPGTDDSAPQHSHPPARVAITSADVPRRFLSVALGISTILLTVVGVLAVLLLDVPETTDPATSAAPSMPAPTMRECWDGSQRMSDRNCPQLTGEQALTTWLVTPAVPFSSCKPWEEGLAPGEVEAYDCLWTGQGVDVFISRWDSVAEAQSYLANQGLSEQLDPITGERSRGAVVWQNDTAEYNDPQNPDRCTKCPYRAVLYLDPGQTYSVNIVGQSTQLRDAAKDRLKLRHPDEVASQGADR